MVANSIRLRSYSLPWFTVFLNKLIRWTAYVDNFNNGDFPLWELAYGKKKLRKLGILGIVMYISVPLNIYIKGLF